MVFPRASPHSLSFLPSPHKGVFGNGVEVKYGPGRFRTLLTHVSVMIPTDQSSDIGSEPIKLRINRSVNNEPLVGWNGIQCVELDVISTLVVWEGNEQAEGPFCYIVLPENKRRIPI